MLRWIVKVSIGYAIIAIIAGMTIAYLAMHTLIQYIDPSIGTMQAFSLILNSKLFLLFHQ